MCHQVSYISNQSHSKWMLFTDSDKQNFVDYENMLENLNCNHLIFKLYRQSIYQGRKSTT